MEVPEGTDLPDGAALAQVACESAFDDLGRGASLDDVASVAEERIAVLERQLPGSSLVPLYRLRLLVVTCRRRTNFYVAAKREVDEARSRDMWPEFQGYCRVLAARAVDDPKAALSLVPEPQGQAPEYVEAMIAETLSNATGQPFGLDLARWRAWLASRQ